MRLVSTVLVPARQRDGLTLAWATSPDTGVRQNGAK
ncbi:hypothetical protein BJ982_000021 [Sphaerisporangium siamense]|uniref:Uncharacterized protein n=1 Tax=Sphaerisporangium siamense TaxID=795645 RepID=A0A7W7D197_9ACTN|nr:hypothetical protein [Sphaerisporangium siamense]